jgi:hypothetical protein
MQYGCKLFSIAFSSFLVMMDDDDDDKAMLNVEWILSNLFQLAQNFANRLLAHPYTRLNQ